MKFLLKRRLNPFLLLTTVVGLSLLVGLSIVFQTQFEDIAGDRAELESEIDELNSEKRALEANNTKLLQQTRNLQNRTSELEQQIGNIESEESNLEGEVERLNNRTSQLEEERNKYREDFRVIRNDLEDICEEEDNLNENSTDVCTYWLEQYEN